MATAALSVMLFAAIEAGKRAAILRKQGFAPDGTHTAPHHHGSVQWAQATGFYEDERLRRCFSEGYAAGMMQREP